MAGLCVLLVATVMVGGRPPADAATPATGWLTTSGSKILDSRGAAYTIKATSWFGMETSNCAPHGLWQISLDTGLAQIASFGFNTIRLPFSNECLATSSPTSINYILNPELEGKTALQVMDLFVAKAHAYGLNVILDRHRPDSAAQSALWYTKAYSEKRWIDDWKMLALRYRSNSTVIGVDLHNEPSGAACWGCGTASRDWAAAATRAGNAILAVNPKLLIIVEGVEKQAKAGTTWWGGGLADAAKHPVKLKVAHRLVYSTHDYPASVFPQKWFKDPRYPANLAGIWTANWGYLQRQGIAPVLLGEFGTTLRTTSDQQWLTALVGYVKTNKMSFAYWSFNPNSGDTGGLVADDWVTPQQAKLTALRPILGAPRVVPVITPSPKPTPSPSATATPSSTAPSASTTTPTPIATPTPTAISGTAGSVQADWHLTSEWEEGYVAELRVTATAARSGWTVSWADRTATSVASAWGMTCSLADHTITCVGADWARQLVPGQPITVGVQVSSPGPAPTRPAVTVA